MVTMTRGNKCNKNNNRSGTRSTKRVFSVSNTILYSMLIARATQKGSCNTNLGRATAFLIRSTPSGHDDFRRTRRRSHLCLERPTTSLSLRPLHRSDYRRSELILGVMQDHDVEHRTEEAPAPLLDPTPSSPTDVVSTLPHLPTNDTPYSDPLNHLSFASALAAVFDRFRIRNKKDSSTDLSVAKDYLLAPSRLVPFSPPSPSSTPDQVHRHVQTQQRLFKSTTGLDQRQTNLALRALTYLGDHCAKTGEDRPLLVAWDKLLETGCSPNKNALSTYLYVLGASPLGGGATEEVAVLHDALHGPTENTVSLRIKAAVETGDTGTAEDLIRSFPTAAAPSDATGVEYPTKRARKKSQETTLKLRTCLPLFRRYCGRTPNIAPRVPSALSLYALMRSAPSVYLDDEIYALLLSSIASGGCFRPDAPAIEGSEEAGYGEGSGPGLLDRLMEDMAEDLLEIDEGCVRTIRNGFARGFDGGGGKGPGVVPDDCTLSPVSAPLATTGTTTPSSPIACRVAVDHGSGVCPLTHTVLRLVRLEDRHREDIVETLVRMAAEQFEAFGAKLEVKERENRNRQLKEGKGGGGGVETSNGGGGGGGETSGGGGKKKKGKVEEAVVAEEVEDFAADELRGFVRWLDEREGKPFTAIVDGANVAYHRTGLVNYKLIRRMVDSLEALGETVLVVMPQKYAQKKFYLRRQHVQELGKDQMEIVEKLTEDGQLYLVSAGCLDDYYWMVASVADQTTSRGGNKGGGERKLVSLDVPPGNEDGRWPGARPSLVSNDQMRDHRLELLEPRLFRRWASTHVVNYHIPNVKDGGNEDGGGGEASAAHGGEEDGGVDGDDDAIVFSPSEFFSHEIQGNLLPGCDTEGDGGSSVWHIPVSDWGRNDRFCIRIPPATP